MIDITKIYDFAKDLHKGQKYGKESYWDGHIAKVINTIELPSGVYSDSDFSMIVYALAALHDGIEDQNLSIEKAISVVMEAGFSQAMAYRFASALLAITKAEGEDYVEYLGRVKSDEIAKIVKIADVRSNLCSERKEGNKNRINKYKLALYFLQN